MRLLGTGHVIEIGEAQREGLREGEERHCWPGVVPEGRPAWLGASDRAVRVFPETKCLSSLK